MKAVRSRHAREARRRPGVNEGAGVPLTRRDFARKAALGVVAVAARGGAISGAEAPVPKPSRVFAVRHKDVCPAANEYRPADPEIVKVMVREGLLRLYGSNSVAEIVREWCPPGKRPDSARVKIKFNGTRGLFPVHHGVVNGIVRLLVREGGIKPENIHVYESCPKNFGEQDRPPIFGTPFAGGKNREPGVLYSQLGAPDGVDMPGSDYRADVRLDLGDGRSKTYTFWYWDALDKDTDILINIPSLKRHISTPKFTTCTFSMKNHYGSIRDPYRHHGPEIGEKIAAVNMAPAVRDKQRLIVVDALYAMFTHGPERGKMKYGVNKLLVARDPVAADYVGWGMLNALEACDEPREIAIAARNGLGLRAPNWQDHVAEIDLGGSGQPKNPTGN